MNFLEYFLLGIKITDISRDEWRNYLYDCLYHSKYARIIVLTEHKMFHALYSRELKETINQADIVLCSSSFVSWIFYRVYKRPIKPSIPASYVLDALSVASECAATVSFYGSTKKILFSTVKKAIKSFPKIKVVAHYPKYIPLKKRGRVFIALRKSAAKLNLINTGSGKKQEIWINKNHTIFEKGLTIGCDDSFEIISGSKRAPSLIMQEKGHLGLYSLCKNPLNLTKILRCLVLLFYFCIFQMFGLHRRKTST